MARLFDSDFHKDFRGPHELVEGFDRQQATQIERAAVLETGLVRASPQPSELAWLTEVLAANSAWMQSLHSQLIAKTEAITTREVELERTNLRLSVQDKTLASMGEELVARNVAIATLKAEIDSRNVELARKSAYEAELRAVYASTSWRLTTPLRGAKLPARWLMRGLRAWLTLKPGSRPRRTVRRLRTLFSADGFPADIPASLQSGVVAKAPGAVGSDLDAANAKPLRDVDAHRH